MADPRPINELRDSGLLWLINRVMFHPRGHALALYVDDAGQVSGWSLEGDGPEPWRYAAQADEADCFRRAERTLRQATGSDEV